MPARLHPSAPRRPVAAEMVLPAAEAQAMTTPATAATCKPGCIHLEPHALDECQTHDEFMAYPKENTMTTQATERTTDHNAVERDVEAIEQALDHLRRLLADRSMRRDNATAAGATLAYEVERFLDDPEGVGTDALRKAWAVFMARHAGNFTDSVMAVDGT